MISNTTKMKTAAPMIVPIPPSPPAGNCSIALDIFVSSESERLATRCCVSIYRIQYYAQFGLIVRIEYIKPHEQAAFLTIH